MLWLASSRQLSHRLSAFAHVLATPLSDHARRAPSGYRRRELGSGRSRQRVSTTLFVRARHRQAPETARRAHGEGGQAMGELAGSVWRIQASKSCRRCEASCVKTQMCADASPVRSGRGRQDGLRSTSMCMGRGDSADGRFWTGRRKKTQGNAGRRKVALREARSWRDLVDPFSVRADSSFFPTSVIAGTRLRCLRYPSSRR